MDAPRRVPVLERVAYLNAGTDGPCRARGSRRPRLAARAGSSEGRSGKAYFEGLLERIDDAARARWPRLLGCDAGEVALTRSTTDGMNMVLRALDLGPATRC